MEIRPAIVALMDTIERSVQKKFLYRPEIEQLIEQTESRGLRQVLDDIVFLAKFIANAYEILSREGLKKDETKNVAAEFIASVEKISTLIRTAVKETPDGVKKHFIETFFSSTQTAMNNLVALCRELARLKNYAIDHKSLL